MKTVSYGKLLETLSAAGVAVVQVRPLDSQFALPSAEWIAELGRITGEYLHAAGIVYQNDKYDCENFSLSAMARAGECWAVTKSELEAGVAVGMFCYLERVGINPGTGGSIVYGHCIICAVHECSKPDTYDVAFYEPQPSQGSLSIREICLRRITLSQEEKASCFCALFA